MHENLPSFFDYKVDYLSNIEAFFKGRVCQVFPKEVEIEDATIHQELRGVREACFVVDAVTTEGVLPWLLKVQYSLNTIPKRKSAKMGPSPYSLN